MRDRPTSGGMRSASILVGLLLAGAPDASAQDVGRTLGGHTFQPSGLVRSEPFITQHFRSQTSGGFATGFRVPAIIGDSTRALEGDVGYLGLGAEYQHAFGRWLAVRLYVGGSGRLGTSGESLLSQGVTAVYSGALDATVKLFRWETAMISGGARFGSSQIYGSDILGYVNEVIEEGGPPDDRGLVVSTDASTARFSLLGAWAPAAWLGFSALGSVGWGDVFSAEDRSGTLYAGGGVASFDLRPLVGVPVGLSAGLDYDSITEQGADIGTKVWGSSFGLHYTGRENFELSLEYTNRRLPVDEYDEDLVVNAIGFNIRYYWR